MSNNDKTTYLSVTELAKMLGISRVAVFKRIKKGQIPAVMIGRSYAVSSEDADDIVQNRQNNVLTEEKKSEITKAVHKVISEYGETLKLLGKE